MQKMNNKKKFSGRGSLKPQNEIISHPPQIDGINLRHSATFRYRATAATSQLAVTFDNLLDTVLVANSAVAGSQLFQTAKIRRVRVWGMPAVGSASSVSVEFSGINNGVAGDQIIHTDTSMGVQPAHVDARPNVRCLASMYQLASAATAFTLSCPAGSVIDLELSFRGYAFGVAPDAVANALVGATAGVVYLRGFDGLATAASNFVPEFTTGQI